MKFANYANNRGIIARKEHSSPHERVTLSVTTRMDLLLDIVASVILAALLSSMPGILHASRKKSIDLITAISAIVLGSGGGEHAANNRLGVNNRESRAGSIRMN